ncbi:MAG: LemA family protein, partial [Oceanidesulfovibrio sp.]
MIPVILVLAVLVALTLYVIAVYNGLVRKRNLVQEAFSGIDVQLKKRTDLIPNLVNTVKGYMEHEREVLEQVTRYRAEAQRAGE